MDQEKLVKVEFRAEAIPYIDSCLLRGKTLASHILLNQTLEIGEIWAYLPPKISLEKRVRLLVGGLFESAANWQRTADMIAAFLAEPGGQYAVFEDAYAEPNDPWIKEKRPQVFSFKSEVYHYLTSDTREQDEIIQTLRLANGYPSIGILTSLGEDQPRIETGQEVDEDILVQLAARTRHLLLGAYDNEAFLVWSAPLGNTGVKRTQSGELR